MKPSPPPSQKQVPRARVRILATSDLHMNLTGFDYYADRPDPGVGLSRTATLIHSARSEATANGAQVLLFDNGDAFQGTPLGDWAAEQPPGEHPLPKAFAALGYDAIGLGNHDFAFGIDTLKAILAHSPCPALGSNVRALTGKSFLLRKVVLQRALSFSGRDVPIRIGVFSVIPPQTTRWEARRIEGRLDVGDMLEIAQEVATELRHEGCDLVIALAHSGLAQADPRPGMENAVIPMAKIAQIDVIIAGHTHLTLPGAAHAGLPHVDAKQGRVHGTPVVMQGWAGSHLGIIDLELVRNSSNTWQITHSRTEARPIVKAGDSVAEDPEMLRLFTPGHEKTRKRVAKPVGQLSQPLHSFFSFFAPDRCLALIAAAQAAALRPILAGTAFEGIPILSAAAPAKFGGRAGPGYYTHVPAGEISVRHIADLHVFPNEIRAAVVSGAQIKDWLDMSAGIYNRLSDGPARMLADPQRTGHNLDVLHGVTYQIDLSASARFDETGRVIDPKSSRIRDLRFGKVPVDPRQEFIIASNDYRLNGGGNFPWVDQITPIPLPTLRIHDILCAYVAGRLPTDPLADAPHPFTFAPAHGQQAMALTCPEAHAYLDEIQTYDPQPLGLNADGFLQVELTL